MMQNPRYHWRQRIEALTDKQCKFGCIYIQHTTQRKCLNSVNLWNCEGLSTKNFVRVCATVNTIRSLLVHENANHCSKKSKEMIKILWHYQMTFMPFKGLQPFKVKLFSENSLWSNILNHLQTKVTPKNPHSCIFLVYNIILRKWELWLT